MAIPRVKSTYSLDVETVDILERVAKRLEVSKSEVLRRAIRTLAREAEGAARSPVDALDALQESLALTRDDAARWDETNRAERHAASARRRERTGS